MRILEARYKSGWRCHCRCDLGEKKSPCLREATFSYARGTWSQRDGIESSHFAKARILVAKVTLCKFHLRTRPSSGARHPNACLRRARLLRCSFVRAWYPWRIGSWKEEFKGKGQAKRAAPYRTARKTSLPIKLPFRCHPTSPSSSTLLFFPLWEWFYLFNCGSRASMIVPRGNKTITDQSRSRLRDFSPDQSTMLLCV